MAFSAPEPDEARTAAEPSTASPGNAEPPRSPLLAALGAGEAAFTAVAHAFAEAFTTAASTQKTVQQRVAELPAELDELRARFSGDELRKAMEAYRAQVERAYSVFAERGEEAWGRLREQPQVREAITRLESYGGKLDARVDATGEKVARAGERFSERAADAVVDATAATADAVEETGTTAAGAIEDAGDETAAVTRKTTRKAAPGGASRPTAPSSD
jgi:heparin binding hemagglutinin HbhA